MRTAIAIGLVLLVAACSQPGTNPIEVSYTPVSKPELILPEVDQITARDVDWVVVTEDNFDEVVADLKANGNSVSLFAVTADGYEAIAVNLANVQKLIRQQQAIIAAYERYSRDVDRAINKGNAENQ